MNALMIRSKVKAEHVPDLEAAVKRVFAALQQAQPNGIRYASCRLPEFRAFQENLKNWIAEPPSSEQVTVIGSYRLF